MHLLSQSMEQISGGEPWIELIQRPGDVIFLSSADSELTLLARAHDLMGSEAPCLRLVNFMILSHNFSVDSYVSRCVSKAKLVVIRLLGGRSYWSYGLEAIETCCRAHDISLIILPAGGEDMNREIVVHGSLKRQDALCLLECLNEGGLSNALLFLRACKALLAGREFSAKVEKWARYGIYWPGRLVSGENSSLCFEDIVCLWQRADAPVVPVIFYRSLLEGMHTAPVDALIKALSDRVLSPLPFYVNSLKDEKTAEALRILLSSAAPALILNATGFALSGQDGMAEVNPFAQTDCPLLQVIFSGSTERLWREGNTGLSARDLAMNVVLPELDGRVTSRAVSFKSPAIHHEATDGHLMTYEEKPDRIDFVAALAEMWVRLKLTPASLRRVAIVLANYPNRDGRVGNGVGYDTPASTLAILSRMQSEGYRVEDVPDSGDALMEALLVGPTNQSGAKVDAPTEARLSQQDYHSAFSKLPESVQLLMKERWGCFSQDPFFREGAFHLPLKRYGHVVIGIQPARGYNIDPAGSYHDPALPPPHGYFAFYTWIRNIFGAHVLIQNGKHGNLEWLPGKACALSQECFPEAMLGPLPHLYPFIVNDPGEGTQAKRRACAVIIDHLTPPLTRAETYGPLRDMEAMLDEYHLALGLDQGRANFLEKNILEMAQATALDLDAGLDANPKEAMLRLDAYLCDVKESQIRNGLHILGMSPTGEAERDLLVALSRLPRGLGGGKDQSLHRAIAADLGLSFDPLSTKPEAEWKEGRPSALLEICPDPWRSCGDAVERIELFAAGVIEGRYDCPGSATEAVLEGIRKETRPALARCGEQELDYLMRGLAGRFVPPGPSGAPTRGRLDVLPTGCNFFSLDNRAVPTPAAWQLGRLSASLMLERHFQDHGVYPASLGLSVWGTSNMRTGGDDIAQALALIGVEPCWDHGSWRVIGFKILPLAVLDRPRIDVTLRISGFFRDAFPLQIDLFASAVRAVAALDEPAHENPIAARMRGDTHDLIACGLDKEEAEKRAGYRVFGSQPGTYGAGLQAIVDESLWDDRAMLAESYINWGAYAYGGGASGTRAVTEFHQRIKGIEAIVQTQDNYEHDLLDSDDYYQFEGGMCVAARHLSGVNRPVYHSDHARPERPVIRSLEEEISRVMRARVVNPKWISGIMRHGYKGAFEIAATVDYMFAFAATTGAVKGHHFEMAYRAFIGDEQVRDFMEQHNGAALKEVSRKFLEAIHRGLWKPRSNHACHELESCAGGDFFSVNDGRR